MLKRVEPVDIVSLAPGGDRVLVGRPVGRPVRDRLGDLLGTPSADTVLPLDFAEVAFVDFSFADEVVCKVMKRVGGGDIEGRYMLLIGMSDVVLENVQAALKLQQLMGVCEAT